MKKFLALVLALVMTMSLVTIGASADDDGFSDADKINNTEAVEVLSEMGVIGGYGDGTFRPQSTLTRGAGAKFIAYLMLGQEKADKLQATYTVFSDVDDTVGLAAYIEWAYARGIVGGYGDGRFGPYDTLTQYAFGKMLLAALGYDAAKEGFTGAGWQKNVYALAFATDIFDGTEGYGACDRETAARFTLAALLAQEVEYGKTIGLNSNFNMFDASTYAIVSKEGRLYGDYLWESYDDLTYYNGYENTDVNYVEQDQFGRPGHGWEYDDWSCFYMDAPVAEYTTEVTICDMLKDQGIPEGSSKDVTIAAYYIDGQNYGSLSDVSHKGSWNSPLDGEAKDCDDIIGGQGTLTQVFDMGDDEYIVTEIHTFLAQVVSADDSGHKHADASELTVWYSEGASERAKNESMDVVVDENVGYEEETYILVNASALPLDDDSEGNELGVPGVTYDGYEYTYSFDEARVWEVEGACDVIDDDDVVAKLVVIDKAGLIENAKFTGISSDLNTATVGGKKVGVNYMYSLSASELDDANADEGYKYDFFVDQYGNVIGDKEPDVAFVYGVIYNLQWKDNGLENKDYAAMTFYAADGSKQTLEVTKFNDGTGADPLDPAGDEGEYGESVAQNKTMNEDWYDVSNIDDNYLGVVKNYGDGVIGIHDGFDAAADVDVTNGDPELEVDDETYVASDKTVYLVKTEVDEKPVYTSYTGFDAVPTIEGADVAVVAVLDENGDPTEDVEFVYIDATDAAFIGNSVIAYVANTSATYKEKAEKYEYTVYVGTTKTTIWSEDEVTTFTAAGLYELKLESNGKINSVTPIADVDNWSTGTVDADCNGSVLKLNDSSNYSITKATEIYVVELKADGTTFKAVKELKASKIAEDASVAYKLNDKDQIVVLYVLNGEEW